ncbi:MAG: hypothetical protein P4L83_11825 [Nevskia sp.]|nr:hypothetical protein [Nevskia sp.]
MDADPAATGGRAATQSLSDEDLRALLLRQLPEIVADAIEQRLIVDDGLAERVRQIEYELLDAYARDRLTPADRAAVRQHLLRTADDRKRVQIARALAQMAPRENRRRSLFARIFDRPAGPPWGALLAGAAAFATLLTLLLLRQPLAPAGAGGKPMPESTAPAYTVSLLAGVTRGTDHLEIRVPAGVGQVRLQAEVDDPVADAHYRLQLSDAAGSVLLSVPDLALRYAGRHAYVEAPVARRIFCCGRRRLVLRPQAPTGKPEESWTFDAG